MTPPLTETLDRASSALRRSVSTVRRGQGPVLAPSRATPDHATLRPHRSDSIRDQSVAALQAVVWIASFVQSVFNEIRGRSDDF